MRLLIMSIMLGQIISFAAAPYTSSKMEQIFDLAVTNLGCWSPKMEARVIVARCGMRSASW